MPNRDDRITLRQMLDRAREAVGLSPQLHQAWDTLATVLIRTERRIE